MSKSWSMNHREVSYTFGPENVDEFLRKNDMDLICNAQQLAIIFSAPNYCSDFDNAGALISVDESLILNLSGKEDEIGNMKLGKRHLTLLETLS
ncbi:hypothetical protein YC2023_113261 [Brassica napus]